MISPVCTPLGDSAITLTFGDGISEELSQHVVAEATAIKAAGIAGVTDIVPAYAALTVYYDVLTIGYLDLRDTLRSIAADPSTSVASPAGEQKTHHIPVRYDGEDLDEVARRTGLAADDVIRIHSSADYRVFVIGFVPGFAYLGPLDARLVLPRRESPRKRVPAGSVAIAEGQTGIYPSETPGGWHIIGSTSVKMFDAFRDRPALIEVGDAVRFEVVA